jgi:hypothetical protein
MPNPVSGIAQNDSASYTDSSPSRSGSKGGPSIFPQTDPSSHMLALPKTHPRLKRWMLVAIVIGGAAALLMISMMSL